MYRRDFLHTIYWMLRTRFTSFYAFLSFIIFLISFIVNRLLWSHLFHEIGHVQTFHSLRFSMDERKKIIPKLICLHDGIHLKPKMITNTCVDKSSLKVNIGKFEWKTCWTSIDFLLFSFKKISISIIGWILMWVKMH